MAQAPRDVSWIIQAIRSFAFGFRPYQSNLRFEGHSTAPRTQPQPKIPGKYHVNLMKQAIY